MFYTQERFVYLLLASLILGFSVDGLLRQSVFGLNFFLLVVLGFVVCVFWAWHHNRSMKWVVFYGAVAIINALMVYVRSSVTVRFWSSLIALGALTALVGYVAIGNYQKLALYDRWRATLGEYRRSLRELPRVFRTAFSKETVSENNAARQIVSPGLVGAVVLLLVFIPLLASADQVFGRSFEWMSRLGDILASLFGDVNLGRLLTVTFWVVMLAGAMLLLSRSSSGVSRQDLTRKLSARDGMLMLGTLAVLFGLFVIIQLQYLFAGGALPDGLTYAEYARQGYIQLLLATLLASAVVIGVVSSQPKNIGGPSSRRLQALASVVILLNAVIVLAAWKRLSLYEAAYGWTMARFVARLGLVCVMLWNATIMGWLWRVMATRALYVYGWYVLVGTLTFAAIANPEAIVAKQNIIERPKREVSLDIAYLASLSPDALPTICASSSLLRADFPNEYEQLKDSLTENDVPVALSQRNNNGLAQHYTASKAYKAKLAATCLRNWGSVQYELKPL